MPKYRKISVKFPLISVKISYLVNQRVVPALPSEARERVVHLLHVQNLSKICQNIAKNPSNLPKFQSKFSTAPGGAIGATSLSKFIALFICRI